MDDLEFLVYHHVADRGVMEGYIIGNVTYSYRRIFANQSLELYGIATNFSLGFSDRDSDEPRVISTRSATGEYVVDFRFFRWTFEYISCTYLMFNIPGQTVALWATMELRTTPVLSVTDTG